VIKKLEGEVMAIVRLPDVIEKLRSHEVIPVGSTTQDYVALIDRELKQWAEVAKAGNIKIQ
jgi:tripartite-type tricarboxylate transporter receptor subunit TctC